MIDKRNLGGVLVAQYLSDGSAVYPISGLPELDEESILTIFDVQEKERDKWIVKRSAIPAGICLDDVAAVERPVEEDSISIAYGGMILRPLQTTHGLVFIDSRYLAPVSDVLDVLELYERTTKSGTPYIVAKAGFLLQAVIMPFDVINEKFVDGMKDLAAQCGTALDMKKWRQAKEAAAANAGQFGVDPSTGEVVEE